MDFVSYLSQLPNKRRLSGVKLKMLERLWNSDDQPFPKPWVSSSELASLSQQSDFGRRLRELRGKLGCDLETEYRQEFDGPGWRLASSQLAIAHEREYLTERQKQKLFSSSGFECAVCGKATQPGVRGLQADHRRPLSRGGTNSSDNWQALCMQCNIGKRRACQGCELPCESCPWAFPEVADTSVVITANKKLLQRIDNYSQRVKKSRNIVMEEAAEYFLKGQEEQD